MMTIIDPYLHQLLFENISEEKNVKELVTLLHTGHYFTYDVSGLDPIVKNRLSNMTKERAWEIVSYVIFEVLEKELSKDEYELLKKNYERTMQK